MIHRLKRKTARLPDRFTGRRIPSYNGETGKRVKAEDACVEAVPMYVLIPHISLIKPAWKGTVEK